MTPDCYMRRGSHPSYWALYPGRALSDSFLESHGSAPSASTFWLYASSQPPRRTTPETRPSRAAAADPDLDNLVAITPSH